MFIDQRAKKVITGFDKGNPNGWDPTYAGMLYHGLTGTRTTAGGLWQHTRSSRTRSKGKYYYEVTIDNNAASNWGIGVATSAWTDGGNQYPGQTTECCALVGGGTVYNIGTALGLAYTTGDVVSVAVDLDNRKIWFRVNESGWHNAVITSQNPEINLGGTALSGASFVDTPELYIAIAAYDQNNKFTANFGGLPYKYAPPCGFRNW